MSKPTPTHTPKKIECERCFEPINPDPKIHHYKIMLECGIEDKDGSYSADSLTKLLCRDCYAIVDHASSPNSWKYTDSSKEQDRKLYYFDKRGYKER